MSGLCFLLVRTIPNPFLQIKHYVSIKAKVYNICNSFTRSNKAPHFNELG